MGQPRHVQTTAAPTAVMSQALIQGIEALIDSPYWQLLSPLQRHNWTEQLLELGQQRHPAQGEKSRLDS